MFDGVRVIASDLDGTLYPLNLARKALSGAYHQCSSTMPWLAAGVRKYFPHLSVPLKYHDGLVETLKTLHERFGIIVVTDANEDVAYRKLKQLGAAFYIDELIYYEMFKHPKNKEYYKRAMENTGLPPYAHVSVGDSLERDIRPSKELGMRTMIVGKHSQIADGCIARFSDIRYLMQMESA